MATPAGWYPDSDGAGGQRYFDGQSWTDQRAPAGAYEAPPLDAPAPASRRARAGRPSQASPPRSPTSPTRPRPAKGRAGEFVLVRSTVKNVGADPQTFFASFNTLSDGTTEYQADDEAWIYLGNTLADLSPGDAIDTAVVFDVPVGTDLESDRAPRRPVLGGRNRRALSGLARQTARMYPL